jgi:predicted PurR-regulated permease PerM
MNKLRPRLERNIGGIVLLILLAGCLLVMRPFVSALLWAVVLCISSWPAYRRLLGLVGNRRTLAASLMTLAMILVVLLPFIIIGATLADNINQLTGAVRTWAQNGPPGPPDWLAKIPMVGAKATAYWQGITQDTASLWAQAQQFIKPVSAWLLRVSLALGSGLLQLALSIFIAFFLFRDGVSAANQLNTAVDRISGEQGKHLLTVAGQTIRGVVYGILGTSLIQAVAVGIGLFIAGVPGAAFLALIAFFVSILPVLGTGAVWIPAALWLFHQGATGWGIFMLVWGVGVSSLDNFVKPWLISQGSDMPFILIFFGVIGGALTFGFIGVFLGPTLLAVGYRLTEEWISSRRPVLPESSPETSSPPSTN